MKTSFSDKVTGFLGASGIVVGCCIPLALLAITVYGLYLAFKASVCIGFLALVLEPAPLFFGLCGLFGHPELAQKLAHALGLA